MSVGPHALQPIALSPPEVFISYARRDYEKVRRIVDQLAALGVDFWLDQQAIEGGANYALAITRGIKQCRVVILMCSDAALRSRNVNQEIMLAWRYERPYLPLLLEPVSFPEQVQYFLEGCQWIEVLDHPATEWLPRVQRALISADVAGGVLKPSSSAVYPKPVPADAPDVRLAQSRADLAGLRALASFNDRIRPIVADHIPPDWQRHSTFRDLGKPPQYRYTPGSHLGLAIEAGSDGHLLLIDEGPEGVIYCLCPSWFAPDTLIRKGVNYLPQAGARFGSFEVSGEQGREQLLAIITDRPLGLDWMPPDPATPARVLNAQDVELLLTRLHQLDPANWVALATYFDVGR